MCGYSESAGAVAGGGGGSSLVTAVEGQDCVRAQQYPLDYLRTTPLKFNTKTGNEKKKKKIGAL
jgi:hypothetical protein